MDSDRSNSPTYSHDGSLTPTPEDLDIEEPDTPKSTGEGTCMLAYTVPFHNLNVQDHSYRLFSTGINMHNYTLCISHHHFMSDDSKF